MLLDFSAPAGRWDCHGLSLTGGILRRIGANTIQKKSNIKWQRKIKWNPWKDKIRRIGYPWTLWARADWAAGEGAQQCGTVFQTTLFSLVINPETSSRVTLALLGIVFQTKQFTTDTHLCFSHFYQLLIHIIYTDALFCYLWLPWSVAIRFGWKPIPSEARVTRDAVSGLTWYIRQLSYLTQWKMKKVEFKLPSTAWGFPIASARFFTFHYSLFTIH